MNNCTFCNAPKTRTLTEKNSKLRHIHFCEECFDELNDFNRRCDLKDEKERVDRGTIGSTGGRNIFEKRGAGQ